MKKIQWLTPDEARVLMLLDRSKVYFLPPDADEVEDWWTSCGTGAYYKDRSCEELLQSTQRPAIIIDEEKSLEDQRSLPTGASN